MRWSLVILAGTLALGCGDSKSEESADTLTCAWLEGDNCWRATVAGALSCLPAADDSGVLDAAGRTCTYASGHVVTFDEPLVLPVPTEEDVDFRFTVAAGGQPCLRLVDTGEAMTLTVGQQTFEQGSQGGFGLRIECPDGTSFENDNALDLLECRGDLLSSLAIMPGYTWSSSDVSLSFGLIGYSDEQGVAVFDCRR